MDSDICVRGDDNALVIEFKKLSDGLADTVTFMNIEAEGTNAVFYLDDPDVMDTLIVDEAAVVTVNPYAGRHFLPSTISEATRYY